MSSSTKGQKAQQNKEMEDVLAKACRSACKNDPLRGVIGVEK